MKKKPGLGIARYGWVTAIALLAAPASQAQGQPCNAGRTGYQYRSDRIEFNLPADWQVNKVENALGLRPDKIANSIPCAIKIEWVSGAPADLAAAHQWYMNRIKSPNMVPIAANVSSKLDDVPALQTAFRIEDPQGDDSVRGAVVTVLLFHEVVAFMVLTPEGEWERGVKVFVDILNSAKLLGVTSFLIDHQPAPARNAVENGQPAQIRNGSFSFGVPAGWQLNRQWPASGGDSRYQLIPELGGGAMIEIRHKGLGAFGTPAECARARDQFEAALALEIGGGFRYVPVQETAPAGSVITTMGTHNVKHPELALMTSAVCSTSDIALMAYAFNMTSTNAKSARDAVLQSISFGNSRPTLYGAWHGQGSVLTLGGDGSAEISFDNGLANHGKYVASGNQLKFEWNTVMSLPNRATWNCVYSLQGMELRLKCDAGGARVYHR